MEMVFTRPVVGPKVYLSRGPSGHAETFERGPSDRELEMYLGKVKVRIAVEGFLRKMSLERRAEHWDDVKLFLAELTQLDVEIIPLEAAIAFWAQVDQMRDAIRKSKADNKVKGN